MNKNMLMILGGGFGVAVMVSVIMVSLMRPGAPEKKEVQDVQMKEVLIATKNLGPGETLSPENTTWKSWPESGVFPGMSVKGTEMKEVSGRVNRSVARGEPVLKSALVRDNPNMLSASLKEGHRAVAINVNAASTAGGFITPGDMVDVIVTFAIRQNPDEEDVTRRFVDRYISETVLENVRIMAIDQEAGKLEEGSRVARTVTLEAKNEGARKLMLANQMGELSLALRAMGDEEKLRDNEALVTDVTTAKIYGEIDKLRERDPVSSGHFVRVLNGSGVQSVPVGTPSPSRSAPDPHLAQR